jgi:hypothetical protein
MTIDAMVGIINPTSIPKTQRDGYGMVKKTISKGGSVHGTMNKGNQDFKLIILNLISSTKVIHVHVTSVGHTNIANSILIIKINHWSVPRSSLPMVMPLISIFVKFIKPLNLGRGPSNPS